MINELYFPLLLHFLLLFSFFLGLARNLDATLDATQDLFLSEETVVEDTSGETSASSYKSVMQE